jgi:hypothetical protein
MKFVITSAIRKSRDSVLALLIASFATVAWAADNDPEVESQPLLAQIRRVREALDALGQPLPGEAIKQLDRAYRGKNDATVSRAVQSALDPLCVGTVRIDGKTNLTFIPSLNPPPLHEQGWRAVLVKVINEPGISQTLRVDSPGARALPESPRDKIAERWIDLETIDRRPLQETLSGLGLEYRVVNVWARTSGIHSATLAFSLGNAGSPNARLDEVSRRVWNFDKDSDGWEAQNEIRFEPRDDTIVLHSTGNDPFMAVNVRMSSGAKIIRFRARTFEEATWQFFWWTEKRPSPDGGRVTHLLCHPMAVTGANIRFRSTPRIASLDSGSTPASALANRLWTGSR